MSETSRYYNSLLPLYLFILMFFIILTSNVKKGEAVKKSNNKQAVINNIRKTFNKEDFMIEIADQFGEDWQYPEAIQPIDIEKLPNIQFVKEFTHNIEKSLFKNNTYYWSIDKKNLFLPNSFFFKNDTNLIIKNIVSLAYMYEKNYILSVKWSKNTDKLDEERFKHIVNIIYETVFPKDYLINLDQETQDSLIISLIPRE